MASSSFFFGIISSLFLRFICRLLIDAESICRERVRRGGRKGMSPTKKKERRRKGKNGEEGIWFKLQNSPFISLF